MFHVSCQCNYFKNKIQLFSSAAVQADLLPGPWNWYRRKKLRAHLDQMQCHVRLNEAKRRRHLATFDETVERPDNIMDAMIAVTRDPNAFTTAANDDGGGGSGGGADGPSEDDLLSAPIEFLSAGSDTSSSTLLWLFLYVALHPDVQSRVHAELDRQLDAVVGRAKYAEHRRLVPYTEAVMREAMRLTTVVPLGLPHCAVRDTTIDGFLVPKDTLVVVNLWSVGRDARVWSTDADVFRPERFLQRRSSSSSPAPQVGHAADRDIVSTPSSSSTGSYIAPATTSSGSDIAATVTSTGSDVVAANSSTVADATSADIVNRALTESCLPFGVGRRRCIGEQLGLVQVFAIFVAVMRRCRVTPADGERPSLRETFGDVVRPHPYRICVVDRKPTSLAG